MARTSTNGSTATASADDVRDQIAALQADIAELTRTVGEYGRARGGEARTAAQNKAEELRNRADHLRHDAEAQLRSGYAQAETAVRDNPAAAVGIAAGLGFIFGLITARK